MNKFYITAAIPYINGAPHIGHALEFIQGDVLARYYRKKGVRTRYITGADENALKNVQAAEKLGIAVSELADKNTVKFQELIKAYNISFDDFIRSSSKAHQQVVNQMWLEADKNGAIYKKVYKGLYCVSCEVFYQKSELVNNECQWHPGKPIEEVEEENYFFKLSQYQEKLTELIESDTYRITPQKAKNEALSFIRQGLHDFSISRSNERARNWGVPVPGDDTQRVYVWFDALNIYRTGADNLWPADVHLIGKDIMRFHAIYWPAMLLASNLELPKNLYIHGFITVNGMKMSKSLGNSVDPFELVEKYGADPIRYYLLREIPTDDDGDYSEEKFLTRYNADLANGLGNLVSRVLALTEGLNLTQEVNSELKEKTQEISKKISHQIEGYKLHDALATLWELISYADKYVNDSRPWEKQGKEKEQILVNLLYILKSVQDELTPFLPETAKKLEALLIKPAKLLEPLFPRL
ncbi:MAG: methionine--tRNA ligase [Candidatus Harrisonbacteria bacterium CG10_big_fil_rev_8_21_14_0_10_38_8]|uniref:methionine--tRNA ligase n=1 Tax=Candidatus Harrisonbacteria bacterium CG10_big_fil_rev_8_21_14_0_10_38_8 TaxID=1974582 RepID=A0A2M6WJY9_9BACT|nr:MAG: methionine--tRNA ligase [Candidatus Harrisonbacteria bacterium CG10_big_fil_rev_8_21_14_0_10_38_8]